MTVRVIFYGTSAASPSKFRGFACIGVSDSNDKNDSSVLLDCGDGSIRNILAQGTDVNQVSSILISHYHSDHISGITQVIETMGIRKRKTDLNVMGPPGLKQYFDTIQNITAVASLRNFKIDLKELKPGQRLLTQGFEVEMFQMDHTLPCLGYRLKSASSGKIVSYTGDTQPCDSSVPLGKNSDLYIHEATFLQKDIEKAKPPKHSTPFDAAIAAKKAHAKKLILTHVNDDYENPDEMNLEARKEFDDTNVAGDGLSLEI
jgi:ribonuclease Z